MLTHYSEVGDAALLPELKFFSQSNPLKTKKKKNFLKAQLNLKSREFSACLLSQH